MNKSTATMNEGEWDWDGVRELVWMDPGLKR